MQTTTHRIGDVTVTIDLPDDCPPPHVTLAVYASDTTEQQRAAAITAFRMHDGHRHEAYGNRWAEKTTPAGAGVCDAGTMRATVFLTAADPLRTEVDTCAA